MEVTQDEDTVYFYAEVLANAAVVATTLVLYLDGAPRWLATPLAAWLWFATYLNAYRVP